MLLAVSLCILCVTSQSGFVGAVVALVLPAVADYFLGDDSVR